MKTNLPKQYDIIIENLNANGGGSTVVAEYTPLPRVATSYQSEAQLEQAFIKKLQGQAYEYLSITSESELIANLRAQLGKLNHYQFSDDEWQRFMVEKIANPSHGIADKTALIQEDYIQQLTRDDGSAKNIYLLDKQNIHNNSVQVVNQYEIKGARQNRYDVTVLVNGLPLVHIELKRRGVDIKQAFNQIERYQRESFWAGCGLFNFVQLFVISNGTHTKYYSNTTRYQHIRQAQNSKSKLKKTSHSFEFTSWWADASNKPIADLIDFTATFFAKHTLLNILTKYCVFTTEHLLLAMRPYQIVATERILNRIVVSENNKAKLGTIAAGGYVWHTTGSGKTLTSFKTAQLAVQLPEVNKVLFVVDRKDLDYQTMREYENFREGAACSNTSTAKLKKQLEDPKSDIIITTIQKVDKFIKQNAGHVIFGGHIVIIFDECHRSQFGEMHNAITKAFQNYHLFGFTGTPIFAKNAGSGRADLKTTEQAFGDKLHTYTILDAITDKNVLELRVEYHKTVDAIVDIDNSKVQGIDTEAVLNSPERIQNVVQYILEHFDQKTKRNSKSYSYNALTNITQVATAKDRQKCEEIKQKIRLSGFNSIFATSSIDAAKLYYAEFNRQMAELPEAKRLKIGLIYSFGVNDDDVDGMLDENSDDASGLDAPARDFLDSAIANYNDYFGTSYDTSADKFQNYYKDVSLRMKNRELDLLIVVNMFLTGFDATTLNTLWVDKNLRMHGLLQAFSRTNRILNSIKTFGHIVCFRNLEDAVTESIALFGDKDAAGVVLLKSYQEYMEGYDSEGKRIRGYRSLITQLKDEFPISVHITSEQRQKDFIALYGSILRLRNILVSFDEFEDLLSQRDIQDYHSIYIDLYNSFRNQNNIDKADITDDVVFEMELIKQIEINIDYILNLIAKYHDSNLDDKEILLSINKAIDSSVELRNKRELILQFISNINSNSIIDDDWHKYVEAQKIEELDSIIADENLNQAEAYQFVRNALRDGEVPTTGTAIANILPPISRFSQNDERSQKRETVLNKLRLWFDKYFDITSAEV